MATDAVIYCLMVQRAMWLSANQPLRHSTS